MNLAKAHGSLVVLNNGMIGRISIKKMSGMTIDIIRIELEKETIQVSSDGTHQSLYPMITFNVHKIISKETDPEYFL